MSSLWIFLASFIALGVFMLMLALGVLLGRRKTRKQECSCKAAARVMAAKDPLRPSAASNSPFKILENDSAGCQCDRKRE